MVHEFDVRPLIKAGSDPFDAIHQRWISLQEGESLAICAPFVPHPLIAWFSSRGIPVQPGFFDGQGCWVLIGPKPC